MERSLPSSDGVILVWREESRSSMIYTVSVDKAGLVANSFREQLKVSNQGRLDKDHLHCYYCRKLWHAKETCWKLNGQPTRSRGGKRMGSTRPQANLFEVVEISKETSIGSLSNEEVQTLRCLLSQLDSQSTIVASSNFVKIDLHMHLAYW
ncbi:PREDICTED: uncharacterized protein LOC18591844 isoform X2 [Theobroma cacao]|uniref:Uncharacterized protein LOC18591844 isoform X2 n=1 Tax=Theobroma cacao TaxID=3641 RepID=A0AB32WUH7_THECC|nr:PREDICTED: uncharacterized protein LOC18591844 isoform X2 [Theobroma cacao]